MNKRLYNGVVRLVNSESSDKALLDFVIATHNPEDGNETVGMKMDGRIEVNSKGKMSTEEWTEVANNLISEIKNFDGSDYEVILLGRGGFTLGLVNRQKNDSYSIDAKTRDTLSGIIFEEIKSKMKRLYNGVIVNSERTYSIQFKTEKQQGITEELMVVGWSHYPDQTTWDTLWAKDLQNNGVVSINDGIMRLLVDRGVVVVYDPSGNEVNYGQKRRNNSDVPPDDFPMDVKRAWNSPSELYSLQRQYSFREEVEEGIDARTVELTPKRGTNGEVIITTRSAFQHEYLADLLENGKADVPPTMKLESYDRLWYKRLLVGNNVVAGIKEGKVVLMVPKEDIKETYIK